MSYPDTYGYILDVIPVEDASQAGRANDRISEARALLPQIPHLIDP